MPAGVKNIGYAQVVEGVHGFWVVRFFFFKDVSKLNMNNFFLDIDVRAFMTGVSDGSILVG